VVALAALAFGAVRTLYRRSDDMARAALYAEQERESLRLAAAEQAWVDSQRRRAADATRQAGQARGGDEAARER
jgi:hypothetical protein